MENNNIARNFKGENWTIEEEHLLGTLNKNSNEYKKLNHKKMDIFIQCNMQNSLCPSYINELNIRYVSIKKEGYPKESGWYLVILENDINVKCVVRYIKDLEHWSTGKKADKELKQEMVTHWLEEKLKEPEILV